MIIYFNVYSMWETVPFKWYTAEFLKENNGFALLEFYKFMLKKKEKIREKRKALWKTTDFFII